MLKNLKLRVKVLFMLLLISLITASIVGAIVYSIGITSLKEESYNKLTAIREMKANQIENYFHQIFNQVISFSEDRMVIEATLDFKNGFDKVEKELNYSQETLKKMDSVLYSYYQTQFLEQLFYRDSIIKYFSIPRDELIKNQNLWLEIYGDDFNVIDAENSFPKINPSEYFGNLNISGSSTVSSLVRHIIKIFKEEGAQGDIIYHSTSSSEGLNSLLSGSDVDIVGISHELRAEESKLFEEANLRPLSFRIGTDALVIVAGKRNNFLSNLSSEELKAAFTTAKMWSDINPDWPKELIKRFIPSEGSGSYNLFVDVILDGDEKALKNITNTTFIKDGENMKKKMDTDPFSVAFFSYNYYDSEASLKILDIDGYKLGNVNINNKTYPLTRPLYLLTTEANLKENKNIAFLLNYFLNTVGLEVGIKLNEIAYWPERSNYRILQYQFIANNPHINGEKDNLIELSEKSNYNSSHQLYHPIFKNFLDRFGYYDIFIIDAESGNIVYSVSKEVDFATNLIHGPYSESNLSNVFKQVMDSNSRNHVSFEDFAPYSPSYNAPASFIASPIFDGDKKIGVLVFQLPINKINQIMTDGYEWENVGLGKTGESYLVGTDYMIKNQSRFLIEDPENYFQSLEKMNISHDIISKIKILNSAIGLQPVITQGTQAALNGETNTQIFKDYRGVEVLSAYKPLSIDQVNWVIMSEIDKVEAFAAIPLMIKSFMYWLFVLFVIVFVISILFARSISRPLQVLTQRATELAQGNLDDPIIIKQGDEIGLLAGNFEKMRGSIKKLVTDLKYINQNLEEEVAHRTEELSTANQQIQGIVDSLADALIIINEHGIVESFSQSAEKMFLYKENEIKGLNINILMSSPHKENHDTYLENYKNTGKAKIIGMEREVEGMRKDGTIFPARLMVSEVSTEKKRLFVGLMSDLTARKKAEEEIRASENKFRSITSTATDAIISADKKGIIESWNSSAEKIFGYTDQEVIGQKLEIIIPEKHRKAHQIGMKRVLDGGEKKAIGRVIELEGLHKNGSNFPIELALSNWEGKEGFHFSGVIRNISERKKVEEILRKAKERMEGELNVAREIQMSMLPLIFPAFPERAEIDIYADLIPAREVGGDFYDFQFLDENHIYFVVGDVSGKGVPAALMMAVTKTLLKSRAGNDRSTASILTHVNNEIAKDNEAYMFITVFIAILNTNTGELVYSNAGHNPSYVIQNNREIKKLGDLHGPVIGAMEDMTYKETSLYINKDDILLAYTDGITESQNKNEELYSDQRFLNLIKDGIYNSPKMLTELIVKSVKEFENGAEQFDDITVLVMQYLVDNNTEISKETSVRISNRLEKMPLVLEHFESFGLENKLSFGIIQKFNIVLDELLNNIISYGFKDDKEHEIRVNIILRNFRLIIIVEDDGIPFNPFRNDPPDTMLTIEERNIGGLGIHIVKNLVDEYNYKRQTNRNIITLVKYNINTR